MTTANTSTTSNLVGTLPPEGSPSQLELLDSLLSAGLLSSAKLDVVEFSVNLGIAFLLCYAVSVFYSRFALALSDKKTFAKTFVIIGMTTMLIISIVKSSLALSLGLVGALSIVRFRAAIKEPEELAYLFLVIAIGLGLGANQTKVTVVSTVVILGLVFLQKFTRESSKTDALHHLSVSWPVSNGLSLDSVTEIVSERTRSPKIKRFDETSDVVDILFIVEIENLEVLTSLAQDIRSLAPDSSIRVIDSKPII